MIIKGCISGKAGCMVNFNYVRIQALIDHYVNTKNVKTHLSILVIWLAKFVLVTDKRLTQYNGFYDNIVHFLLHNIDI